MHNSSFKENIKLQQTSPSTKWMQVYISFDIWRTKIPLYYWVFAKYCPIRRPRKFSGLSDEIADIMINEYSTVQYMGWVKVYALNKVYTRTVSSEITEKTIESCGNKGIGQYFPNTLYLLFAHCQYIRMNLYFSKQHLSIICISRYIFLCVYLYIYLSFYLSIYLPIYLSIYPYISIYLSQSLSPSL